MLNRIYYVFNSYSTFLNCRYSLLLLYSIEKNSSIISLNRYDLFVILKYYCYYILCFFLYSIYLLYNCSDFILLL